VPEPSTRFTGSATVGAAPTTARVPSPARPATAARRRVLAIVAAAAVLLLTAGGAAWALTRTSTVDISGARAALATKVCARIARSGHGLAKAYDGSYHTGNCIPIQRY
jgi:uncharacterized protein (DUF2141 family)